MLKIGLIVLEVLSWNFAKTKNNFAKEDTAVCTCAEGKGCSLVVVTSVIQMYSLLVCQTSIAVKNELDIFKFADFKLENEKESVFVDEK